MADTNSVFIIDMSGLNLSSGELDTFEREISGVVQKHIAKLNKTGVKFVDSPFRGKWMGIPPIFKPQIQG